MGRGLWATRISRQTRSAKTQRGTGRRSSAGFFRFAGTEASAVVDRIGPKERTRERLEAHRSLSRCGIAHDASSNDRGVSTRVSECGKGARRIRLRSFFRSRFFGKGDRGRPWSVGRQYSCEEQEHKTEIDQRRFNSASCELRTCGLGDLRWCFVFAGKLSITKRSWHTPPPRAHFPAHASCRRRLDGVGDVVLPRGVGRRRAFRGHLAARDFPPRAPPTVRSPSAPAAGSEWTKQARGGVGASAARAPTTRAAPRPAAGSRVRGVRARGRE